MANISTKKFSPLPNDANEIEKLRYKICLNILSYTQENNLNSTSLSKKINIDRAIINRILNQKYERYSIDKLLEIYIQIKPDFNVSIS